MEIFKSKSKFFWIINSLVVLFAGSLQAGGQIFSHSPEPWRAEYEISLKGFEFSHPTTVISEDELAIIRKRILYDVEPQKTAFNQLKEDSEAALEFIPNAPQLLEIPGGYVDPDGLDYARNLLWANCHAAYSCALRYALTGEQLYAEKAIEVLMHWAHKGTRFYGDDSGLQLGSYFSPMLYAADLLYYYPGWITTEKDLFKAWWRDNCLLDGDVLGVLRRKDNNWKDAALLGTISASVVLEDTLLLKEALIQLKSYFFSRTDDNVQIPGKSWKIAVNQHGVYLPREVVRNDGRSGLTYTAYALTTMVQGMEIARYAGFDFWQDTTELGATLGDVIQQYYAWDILDESFPWNYSPTKSDKRRNAYELGNLYYDFSSDYKKFIEKSRPITGREGDEYSTLNKGDMTGMDTIPAAAPSMLSTETLSSTKISLTWNDNSSDEYGFKIERSSGQDFLLIDSCGPGTVYYLDTGLVAGTVYNYRVYGFKASRQVNYSNESASRTMDFPEFPPEVPVGLKATMISSEQIELLWYDNSDTEEGYTVERKSEEVFTEIAQLGVNDTLFSDKGLQANTAYTYRIRSFNLAGYSGYSDQVVITTLAKGGKFQAENGIVSMEAEYGELGSLWNIGQEEFASGGKFLEINPTRNNTSDQPECEISFCLATYFFTIKDTGDYNFWFRILSEGDENDSFFWRIGTEPWVLENGRSGIGNWYSSQHEQLTSLSSGDYILEITYRENGTRLDKFVFQLDTIVPPAGAGPDQSIGLFPLPPKKPASLVAEALSSSSIKIKWTDYASDEDGYIIERKENDSFIELAQLAQNANAYTDVELSESTSFIYRVYAFNASGRSNYSNNDTATTFSTISVPLLDAQEESISAYPNPFTEITSIRFRLNKPAKVSIVIYNAMGQQMVHLGDKILNSGWHELEWDATDSRKNKAPVGIYFCKFQNGLHRSIIPLMLIE
ncbi:MAG: alginate lyase family protein [Bacteroidales bacterium]|nr:alginate lyase family protein [Bacteroidales bacterium]MCF8391844.1 alginate lyase family protein [Bacteroidales bacterium]